MTDIVDTFRRKLFKLHIKVFWDARHFLWDEIYRMHFLKAKTKEHFVKNICDMIRIDNLNRK